MGSGSLQLPHGHAGMVAASHGRFRYDYGQLHRWMNFNRGDLNAGKDQINNLDFDRDRSLEALGNWWVFDENVDGASKVFDTVVGSSILTVRTPYGPPHESNREEDTPGNPHEEGP